ncbi:MAG: acetate--CoA ligase family protein, partial [Nitratireductor sp.]
IVAMKVGRSAAARAATVSHTASLAGSDAAAEAFFARIGIARVHSIPAFIETLKLLHAVGPLSGPRLSSMSCSGGEASVMADAAEGRPVGFPPLAEPHRKRVKQTLGPLVAVANPLDYHTFIWNDREAMTTTFSAMIAGGFDLNMLVLDFPRRDRCADEDWWPTVDAFATALAANAASGAIVASLPENLPEDYCASLLARGVAPLCGMAEALDAAEAAAAIGEAWKRPLPPPVAQAPPARLCPPGPFGGMADEAAAKSLLAEAGLAIPSGRVVESAEDASFAATGIGFPVALKALGIAHKSERDAVRLGLTDGAAVHDAATALLALSDRLYVERMVDGGIAELIVGVTRDPLFGPVMTVGSGGVLVELLRDTETLLLPPTRAEIEAALRRLELFPLLDGYRGRPRADLEAAIDIIAGVADFAGAHADTLDELDINPLIVCAEGQGAWIADALIVFTPPSPRGEG